MGMRAATGAISEVKLEDRAITCRVLGNAEPQVSAVAVGGRRGGGTGAGRIQSSGRFADGASAWELAAPVVLTQKDIRELQLAKGAIAAGIRILVDRLVLPPAN